MYQILEGELHLYSILEGLGLKTIELYGGGGVHGIL